MKKIQFVVVCLICLNVQTVVAQTQEDLTIYNKERLNFQKKGMATLGIWSVGNIAWGAVGSMNSEGATKEFHNMNMLWNGINLAIAVPGYLSARKGKTVLTLRQSYKEQKKMEKSFLFNAGLDVGYMLGGLYLTEKSKNVSDKKKHDQNLGYGNSFIVQGGFLFLLDATLYTINARHCNKKLDNFLDKVTIGAGTVGYIHRF